MNDEGSKYVMQGPASRRRRFNRTETGPNDAPRPRESEEVARAFAERSAKVYADIDAALQDVDLALQGVDFDDDYQAMSEAQRFYLVCVADRDRLTQLLGEACKRLNEARLKLAIANRQLGKSAKAVARSG